MYMPACTRTHTHTHTPRTTFFRTWSFKKLSMWRPYRFEKTRGEVRRMVLLLFCFGFFAFSFFFPFLLFPLSLSFSFKHLCSLVFPSLCSSVFYFGFFNLFIFHFSFHVMFSLPFFSIATFKLRKPCVPFYQLQGRKGLAGHQALRGETI